MTEETWRPVPSHVGLYEVSDLGRVRSLDRIVVGAAGRQRRVAGRILRPTLRPDGRHKVALCRGGVETTRLVAHLVLEAFVGPRPGDLDACHNDDDQGNDRLANLRWDTHLANCKDRTDNGGHGSQKKDRCPRYHLLRSPNIRAYDVRRGTRNCLACHRATSRYSWAKRKGIDIGTFQEVADSYYADIMVDEEIA